MAGILRMEKSTITITVLSESTYEERRYQWIEFEHISENFDTQDLHSKEYLSLLTKDKFIWTTGCGFPFGVKRSFNRFLE